MRILKACLISIILLTSIISIPLTYSLEPQKTYLKTFSSENTFLKILSPSFTDSMISYSEKSSEDKPVSYEFNITLAKAPISNVLTIPLETQGLEFYFQPPLTEQLNIKDYDFVNETHAIKEKRTVVYVPENVVYGYSVYKTVIGKGETGKLYQVYRPLVIDAIGNSVWASLEISKTEMNIILDKDFLASANYPIIIDPIIGYSTIGSSAVWEYSNKALASKYTTTEASLTGGNITIFVYAGWDSITGNADICLWDDNSGQPGNLLISSTISFSSAQIWRNTTVTYTLSTLTTYWVGFGWGYSDFMNYYYDSGATNQTARGLGYDPGFDPFDFIEYFNRKISAYIDYTAETPPDTTAPTYSSLSTSSTLAGSLTRLNCTWTDETSLAGSGGYIFISNNTGTLTNGTWTAFSSNPELVSSIITLNSSASHVQWGYYANDTSNNWNFTGFQNLVLTVGPSDLLTSLNSILLTENIISYTVLLVLAFLVLIIGTKYNYGPLIAVPFGLIVGVYWLINGLGWNFILMLFASITDLVYYGVKH